MTTRLLIYSFAFSFFLSCNADQQKPNAEGKEASAWTDRDTIIIWSVDADRSIRTRLFTPEDSIDRAIPVINGMHALWPEAGLYVSGQRADTLIVGLRNERWLTDEIGNEGAESFLSFVSLNLLEIKGVNHIYFQLRPGMHAGADTWQDSDFSDWKEGK